MLTKRSVGATEGPRGAELYVFDARLVGAHCDGSQTYFDRDAGRGPEVSPRHTGECVRHRWIVSWDGVVTKAVY